MQIISINLLTNDIKAQVLIKQLFINFHCLSNIFFIEIKFNMNIIYLKIFFYVSSLFETRHVPKGKKARFML